MPFPLDTAEDFREWLRGKGRHDLASEIVDGWCWSSVKEWATDSGLLGTKLHEEFVQELIAYADNDDLLEYLAGVEHRDDVLRALLDTGCAGTLLWYLRDIGHNDDVLRVFVGAASAHQLRRYLETCGDHPSVTDALKNYA